MRKTTYPGGNRVRPSTKRASRSCPVQRKLRTLHESSRRHAQDTAARHLSPLAGADNLTSAFPLASQQPPPVATTPTCVAHLPAQRLVGPQGIKDKPLLWCTWSAAKRSSAFHAPPARSPRRVALAEATGSRAFRTKRTCNIRSHMEPAAAEPGEPLPPLLAAPRRSSSLASPCPARPPFRSQCRTHVRTALASPCRPPAAGVSACSRGCHGSLIVNLTRLLVLPNNAQAGGKRHAP